MKVFVLPSWYTTTYNPLNASFFKEQAVALAKVEISVVVIAPALISFKEVIRARKLNFGFKRYARNGIEEYVYQFPRIPYFDRINYFLRMIIGKMLLKKAIAEHGTPNVSHVHSYKNGGLAIWLKHRFNIPYVITEHNSEFLRGKLSTFHKQQAQKAFSYSNKNIAVSPALAQALKQQFSTPFSVIPNIIDTDYFTPLQRDIKSTYTFLNVAHLNKNKNQAMLVSAFAKFNKDHNESRLVILGGGEEMNNLKHLIKVLNVSEKVTLFGYASRDEVKEFMQLSDCFVLPSIVETFGVVLIEAMACGVPVLASKCGGPESIVTKETGILFENNEEALLSAMKQLYKSNYSSDEIRKHTIARYSEIAVSKQIVRLYKECQ